MSDQRRVSFGLYFHYPVPNISPNLKLPKKARTAAVQMTSLLSSSHSLEAIWCPSIFKSGRDMTFLVCLGALAYCSLFFAPLISLSVVNAVQVLLSMFLSLWIVSRLLMYCSTVFAPFSPFSSAQQMYPSRVLLAIGHFRPSPPLNCQYIQ
jgi:hypothetical protein